MTNNTHQDPLQQVRFSVRVTTLATEVVQQQLYHNTGSQPIEAVYTFPVPLYATLLEATVITEGRELRLSVQARACADREYEEALADGHAAYQIEQSRPGLYTLSAGNLAAGQQAQLHLRWAMLNHWHDNRLALRLPTTLTERYGNAEAVGVSGAALPHSSILLERRCDVDFCLDETLSTVRWDCASHALTLRSEADGRHLAGSGISMDRDIVLLLHRTEAANQLVTMADGRGWMAIAQLHASPATNSQLQAASAAGRSARHLILLVDCSGSMAGISIQQARAGAMALLDWLQPEQRVNLIRFGSTQTSLFNTPQAVSEQVVQQLQRCILDTTANMGGTNTDRALALAMQQAAQCEDGADILLLTDGAIWRTEQALATLTGNTRVFTIGVGFAANEEAIERLAERSRGYCDVVSPDESIADSVRRQYQRMCSGAPMTARAQWPEHSTRWPHEAELYAGDATFLFALGSPASILFADNSLAPPTSLQVTVTGNGTSEQVQLQSTTCETLSDDTLLRLAAAERLKSISDQSAREQFALRYQLLCEHTSLIVVDEAAQIQGMPEVVPVAHMMPAGLVSSESARPVISKARSNAMSVSGESKMCEKYCLSSHFSTDSASPWWPAGQTDIPHFFQACHDLVAQHGVAALPLSLLSDAGFPVALIRALTTLAEAHPPHQLICALLRALAKHDASLTLPDAVQAYSQDDALYSRVLLLVRKYHAHLFPLSESTG